MIAFGAPLWLVGLIPAIAFVLWAGRVGRSPVSAAQHRLAKGARSTAMALVLVALAQPTIALQDDRRSVLFLVDRSDSVSAAAAAAQDAYLEAALADTAPNEYSALAVFGSEVRVDSSLAAAAPFTDIRAVVDGSRTDVSGALAAGAALLPTSGSRRIVLLTDAVPTTGDPRPAGQDLAEQGIVVDVVTFDTGRGPDALVEAVRMPSTARVGDNVTSTIIVRSNQDGPAILAVAAGDSRETIDVELVSGTNEIEVTTRVEQQGFLNVGPRSSTHRSTASRQTTGHRVSPEFSGARPWPLSKAGRAEADQLVAALTAVGMVVSETQTIPTDAELLAYDAVVLVNVPAPGPGDVDRLRAYVEDLGRGLVVVGRRPGVRPRRVSGQCPRGPTACPLQPRRLATPPAGGRGFGDRHIRVHGSVPLQRRPVRRGWCQQNRHFEGRSRAGHRRPHVPGSGGRGRLWCGDRLGDSARRNPFCDRRGSGARNPHPERRNNRHRPAASKRQPLPSTVSRRESAILFCSPMDGTRTRHR